MKASNPYLKLELNIFNKFHIMNLIKDLGYEGFGAFIAIKTIMAENENFPVDCVSLVADKLNIDTEYLQKILDRKDLFYIKNGEYINDEVHENLATVARKSDNCRKAAFAKHNKERAQKEAKQKAAEQTPSDQHEELNYTTISADDKIIDKIFAYYNKVFDKKYEADEETRQKIADICNKNNERIFKNEFLEKWEIIFSNAIKGWQLKEGKKKPILKNILANWNAYLNDDYNLDETYLSPAEEELLQQTGQEKLDSEIDELLSIFEEYSELPDDKKIIAQKIYSKKLEETTSDKAVKSALKYCREQVQDV